MILSGFNVDKLLNDKIDEFITNATNGDYDNDDDNEDNITLADTEIVHTKVQSPDYMLRSSTNVRKSFIQVTFLQEDIEEELNFNVVVGVRHQIILGTTVREKTWFMARKLYRFLEENEFQIFSGSEDTPNTIDIRAAIFTRYTSGTISTGI